MDYRWLRQHFRQPKTTGAYHIGKPGLQSSIRSNFSVGLQADIIVIETESVRHANNQWFCGQRHPALTALYYGGPRTPASFRGAPTPCCRDSNTSSSSWLQRDDHPPSPGPDTFVKRRQKKLWVSARLDHTTSSVRRSASSETLACVYSEQDRHLSTSGSGGRPDRRSGSGHQRWPRKRHLGDPSATSAGHALGRSRTELAPLG